MLTTHSDTVPGEGGFCRTRAALRDGPRTGSHLALFTLDRAPHVVLTFPLGCVALQVAK